jgi:hypothetical protein
MDYKQKILEALQAKFTGGNAGVLNWIATQLAKTVTDAGQVQTAVDGITQEYVSMMESYGDSRATSSAQTAVKNYETNHGLKDGKPAQSGEKTTSVTQPAKGGAPKEEIPSWAQTLLEQNKTLTERLDKFDTERTTTTRKSQLSQIIDKLPEKLRKPYERIALDGLKDDEFTALVSEVTTEVDGILNDMKQKGATFTPPAASNGGTGAKATDAEVDAVLDKLNI